MSTVVGLHLVDVWRWPGSCVVLLAMPRAHHVGANLLLLRHLLVRHVGTLDRGWVAGWRLGHALRHATPTVRQVQLLTAHALLVGHLRRRRLVRAVLVLLLRGALLLLLLLLLRGLLLGHVVARLGRWDLRSCKEICCILHEHTTATIFYWYDTYYNSGLLELTMPKLMHFKL